MNRIVRKEVFDVLGESGVRKLVIALTETHNNRQIAKEFDLTLWQVIVCNQFLPSLCGELLKRENAAHCIKMPQRNKFFILNAKDVA
jgi:hypothetical protein